MQNSNQPNQQTDKNKGDQSAVEQQQKETLKKPSPENMGGAQNAQQGDQADQEVTGQKPHITNNDGASMEQTEGSTTANKNASGQGNKDVNMGQGSKDVNMESNRQDSNQWLGKDKDKNQGNKGDMGGSNQRQDQQDQSKRDQDQSKQGR